MISPYILCDIDLTFAILQTDPCDVRRGKYLESLGCIPKQGYVYVLLTLEEGVWSKSLKEKKHHLVAKQSNNLQK